LDNFFFSVFLGTKKRRILKPIFTVFLTFFPDFRYQIPMSKRAHLTRPPKSGSNFVPFQVATNFGLVSLLSSARNSWMCQICGELGQHAVSSGCIGDEAVWRFGRLHGRFCRLPSSHFRGNNMMSFRHLPGDVDAALHGQG
jgi:hypothetical protein